MRLNTKVYSIITRIRFLLTFIINSIIVAFIYYSKEGFFSTAVVKLKFNDLESVVLCRVDSCCFFGVQPVIIVYYMGNLI